MDFVPGPPHVLPRRASHYVARLFPRLIGDLGFHAVFQLVNNTSFKNVLPPLSARFSATRYRV